MYIVQKTDFQSHNVATNLINGTAYNGGLLLVRVEQTIVIFSTQPVIFFAEFFFTQKCGRWSVGIDHY